MVEWLKETMRDFLYSFEMLRGWNDARALMSKPAEQMFRAQIDGIAPQLIALRKAQLRA